MKFRKETEFQETEIGKIPRDWRIVRLKDVAMEIKSGFASGKRDEVDGIIHLRMFNIDLDGMLSFDEIIRVPRPKDWKQYLLRHGDILLVNTSGSEEHIGKVAIFENVELECTYSNHLTRIRIDENKADSRWVYFVLYYLLQTGYFKSLVHQQAGGQRNIPLKAIENLSITLPPASEARKIAEFLSMFNTTIKLYREEMTRLERLKRGLMSELLTGRIRVKEENGRLSFYRETELQETKIGKIPKDWKVVKLGEVVEIWDKYRIPVKENERKPGPYPYCGANGIIDYIDGYTHDGEFVLLAEDGGFFGRFEKSAYVMRGKFWANNHVHVLKAIKGIIINEFLMHYLNFTDLTPFITGSTRPKLNQEAMKKIPIALPSIIEQMKIAEILSKVDDAIKNIDNAIARLERLKRGLMDLLLTGKVRVVDSDVGS